MPQAQRARAAQRKGTTATPREILTPDDQYRRLFDTFVPDSADRISPRDVAERLSDAGLPADDPRVRDVASTLLRDADSAARIDLDHFIEVCRQHSGIIARAIRGELVIPDFSRFCRDLDEIFESSRRVEGGAVADYIPQLERVDPERFALTVSTVDGQQYQRGDALTDFCLQSVCKPVTYCLALEEHGADYVHKHVGREPSGQHFNELTLNGQGLPHNPMINSGAIMAAALIRPGLSTADRFDIVAATWRRLTGGRRVGFDNAVYLSERQTAYRNFALAYFMREHEAFPPDADLVESLELYFQTCSIELDARSLATVAATLANGGVVPATDDRVFSAETVRKCLSLMSSCGMYNYSGEFAFSIGLPAKSGVSGVIMVVVPRVLGMCIWSPRLDEVGNSVRGIEVCKQLVSKFNFHAYDSIVAGSEQGRRDPRLGKNHLASDGLVRLCWAASQGDLQEVRSLIASGVDANMADYDGRTALHLAASEGQREVVEYLLDHGVVTAPVDRWGGTPLIDAQREGHAEVIDVLQSAATTQHATAGSAS
jgi:glutaminase